jgi:hypothetical protein
LLTIQSRLLIQLLPTSCHCENIGCLPAIAVMFACLCEIWWKNTTLYYIVVCGFAILPHQLVVVVLADGIDTEAMN